MGFFKRRRTLGEDLRRQPELQSLREFAQTRPPTFSQEQMAMREIMSGGSINKMWGFNNNPVSINHDLNPRQRGDFSTSEMFGAGIGTNGLFGDESRETSSMFGF